MSKIDSQFDSENFTKLRQNYRQMQDFISRIFCKYFYEPMCSTIASLGGHEYMRLENEALLGFAILSFIYSIPVHWIWSKNGWLKFNEIEANGNDSKTRDFAGAGIVFLALNSFKGSCEGCTVINTIKIIS